MIKRYEVKEIESIWSEANKFKNWFDLELLVCEALNSLKIMPDADLSYLKEHATYKIENIYELEKELKHDVVAFTRALSMEIPNNTKKWIHYGLTSTDLVDTSNGMNFKKSNDLILKAAETLLATLKQLALDNKYVEQIGRTHGVHAQVNSLGLKFLNYYEILKRWIEQFNYLRTSVEVVKLSGAIGNYSFQNPYIEEYVSQKLGLSIAHFSTQVVSRDRHSMYFSCLANFGLIVNMIATEIRHLHRTEVNEVCEGFDTNQKGSSAMPHKKNPITCENICGMSRLLTGLCHTTWENVDLWHERDISHSSNERIIFCDAISLVIYLANKMNYVLQNVSINQDALEKNIASSRNKNISQAVLLHLIKHTDSSREEIYDLIQSITKNNLDLIAELKKSPYQQWFEGQAYETFKDEANELKYIDMIYKKAGL